MLHTCILSIYVTVKRKTEMAKMKLSLYYYSWKGKKVKLFTSQNFCA